MTQTITQQFAAFCNRLSYDDIPPDTLEYTKKLIADTLATSVGGYYWTESGDVMYDTAVDLESGMSNEREEGAATVLATGDRLSPPNAALVNGALSHSLDYDNRHSAGSLHVGSSVVTSAVAAAESTGADGKTILEAIIAGYDVSTRLGMACNPRSSHERGFHPTGACGTFGSTAAVGVIHGLTIDEFCAAFGVNGSQASGSYQCSLTGGWNKRIHPGLAARDAFTSVAYATNGFEAPSEPIEGELGFLQAYAERPKPERATDRLGEVYEAARTKIKPYPLGTFTHVPIALLIDLVEEEELSPDEIREITIEIPSSGAAFFGRSDDDSHPTGSSEAQFDMPFAAALAISFGRVTLETFTEAVRGEYPKEFIHLMDSTTTVGSEEFEEYLPELYPARVTVRTQHRTYERDREWVHGEPAHPLSWNDLETKVADLTAPHPADIGAEILRTVKEIESATGRGFTHPFRKA